MHAARISLTRAATAALLLLAAPHYNAMAQSAKSTTTPTPRLSDGRPDLTGYWTTGEDFPAEQAVAPDLTRYKPQYLAKVKENLQRRGFADPVWTCAQPGLPRVEAPRAIVQHPGMVVFVHSDFGLVYAGNVPRIIPTDGRAFPKGNDPSFYGDSVGHWEGDTLVVESQNFVDSTWMGSWGQIHSDQMKVTERLRRDKDKLYYEVTVTDPVMLTGPWKLKSFELTRTDMPLNESFTCMPLSDNPQTNPHAILEQQAIEREAIDAGKDQQGSPK